MTSNFELREEISRRRIELYRAGESAREIEWEQDDPESVFSELLCDCAGDAALVLDVECGGGYVAARIAELAGCVIAVDASDAFLREAAATSSRSNLHFARADARGLPFENDSFDLLYSHFGLDVVQIEALAGIHGAMKPGAQFIALVAGESHFIEAQGVFGRGVGWPSVQPLRFAAPEKLRAVGLEMLFFAEYYASCYYPDLESLSLHLAASGAIPDLDFQRDASLLREANRALRTDRGIHSTEHAVLFIARKPV